MKSRSSLDLLVENLSQYRVPIWTGLGITLCRYGGSLKHTSMFIPLLRLGDPDDAEAIIAHLGRSLGSTFSLPPSQVHPSIQQTARALAIDVVLRAVDIRSLFAIGCNGVAVSLAFWLDATPPRFLCIDFHQRWRSLRFRMVGSVRRYCGQCGEATLRWLGVAGESKDVAKLVVEQVALSYVDARMRSVDRAMSAVTNTLLGVELLRRSCAEAEPGLCEQPVGAWTMNVACGGVGIWGLYMQAGPLVSIVKQANEWGRRLQQSAGQWFHDDAAPFM